MKFEVKRGEARRTHIRIALPRSNSTWLSASFTERKVEALLLVTRCQFRCIGKKENSQRKWHWLDRAVEVEGTKEIDRGN